MKHVLKKKNHLVFFISLMFIVPMLILHAEGIDTKGTPTRVYVPMISEKEVYQTYVNIAKILNAPIPPFQEAIIKLDVDEQIYRLRFKGVFQKKKDISPSMDINANTGEIAIYRNGMWYTKEEIPSLKIISENDTAFIKKAEKTAEEFLKKINYIPKDFVPTKTSIYNDLSNISIGSGAVVSWQRKYKGLYSEGSFVRVTVGPNFEIQWFGRRICKYPQNKIKIETEEEAFKKLLISLQKEGYSIKVKPTNAELFIWYIDKKEVSPGIVELIDAQEVFTWKIYCDVLEGTTSDGKKKTYGIIDAETGELLEFWR